MRTVIAAALILSLSGCAGMRSNADAVRDGTKEQRREHAQSLLGNDIDKMRVTGEALLTSLACGWNEDQCPQ